MTGKSRYFSRAEFLDHGPLRLLYPHFAPVGGDIYRSAQPSGRDYPRLHALGIRTIVNLRGDRPEELYKEQVSHCENWNIELKAIHMFTKGELKRTSLVEILDAIRNLPRPLLFHCKSGADRTGLIAALLKLGYFGASEAEAREQLSWRFLHFRNGKMGLMDQVFDGFVQYRHEENGDLDQWVHTRYKPVSLGASGRSDGKAPTW